MWKRDLQQEAAKWIQGHKKRPMLSSVFQEIKDETVPPSPCPLQLCQVLQYLFPKVSQMFISTPKMPQWQQKFNSAKSHFLQTRPWVWKLPKLDLVSGMVVKGSRQQDLISQVSQPWHLLCHKPNDLTSDNLQTSECVSPKLATEMTCQEGAVQQIPANHIVPFSRMENPKKDDYKVTSGGQDIRC